jgi:hypothetical protein
MLVLLNNICIKFIQGIKDNLNLNLNMKLKKPWNCTSKLCIHIWNLTS